LIFADMDAVELNDREELATKMVHPVTGQTFCELAAEVLARGVKLDPTDLARVKRIAPCYIGPADAKWSLPEALLLHFPGDKDFKDMADGENVPCIARNADEYIDEMRSVLQRTGPRLDNDLFHAERRAGRVEIPPGDGNPADVHLREERIDALAFLLSLFAVPAKFAADPVERGAYVIV
jgi:hypothetical protein